MPLVRRFVIDRVVLGPAVRASIAGHIAAVPDRETGGILLGRSNRRGVVTVTKVSPPGPRAVHKRYFFLRDTRFLQRWLDNEYERSDAAEDYVGEWHVHPKLDAPPSCVDRRAHWRIARRSNYKTDEPVLLIVENAPAARRFRVYGFEVRPKRWQEAECLFEMPE